MKAIKPMPIYFRTLRAVLDYFIPADWPEGNRKNSARNVIAASITMLLLVGPFAPICYWQGNSEMALFVVFVVMLAIAVVLVLRYFGALRLALAMSLIDSMLICPVGWYLGGRDDPVFVFVQALFPITCTFMFGAGWGLVSMVYAMVAAGVMAAAPVFGWLPYPYVPLRDAQLIHGLYLMACVGGCGILAALFQFAKTLSDVALMEARRHSEELAATKSVFLANMSHEIRTPMNAIIGLSGLALKNDMPPRVQDYLVKIKHSGEHLLGIINDILDFSKIESGKLEIETVPFELESVIDNVVNLVSDKADAKGLEFLCQVDPAIPRTLVGDPLRIGQILINLANNAVKFTAKGEVRMAITVQAIENQRARVLFEVQDTGIGLSDEQMGKIFKSFEQADASTTRQYGGTGLGLAISKNLTEAMGGQIGVRSALGQGSTFWFCISLGVGSAEPFLPMPAVDLRGKRVLVVDDNTAAGLVLADTLAELGFTVDRVESGAQALELLQLPDRQDKPYAFVMMDWLMPEMDGLETIQAIQKLRTGAAPCVLMVTAHRRDEVVKGAQAMGVSHVLSKPVSGSVLINTMMQVMGMGTVRTELAAFNRNKVSALEAQLQRITGARLLVVEDNEINQQVACEILGQAGFTVDVAENGKIAVHQVQARFMEKLPYDLVLMDMQMPVMDGVAAARLIRETFSAEKLPIVAMTANAMKADRDRCLEAGMNGFVTKPIDPDDLWTALLTWVKVREGMGIPVPLPQPPVDAAPPEPLLQALRGIDGLDVELGLARTNNNPAFYVSMLRRVLQSQEGAVSRIAHSLASGDLAAAERGAHTLKGLAANMGASPLQGSADRLEQALKNGATPADCEAALAHTQQHLAQFVEALKAVPGMVLAEPALRSHTLSVEERQQGEQVVRKIRFMLEDDNATALELWESHAATLRLMYPQAAEIEEAIGQFDFEKALQLLA